MAKYFVGGWRVGPHVLLKGQASPSRSSWRHQLIEESCNCCHCPGSPGPLLGPEPSLDWTKASGLQTTQRCQPPTLSRYSPHTSHPTYTRPALLLLLFSHQVVSFVTLSHLSRDEAHKWIISTLGNHQNWGKGFQTRASLVTQRERTHLPMQETRVRPLGREDPLEKGMATHSSILA